MESKARIRSILLLNKKEGETPLQALDRFRRKNKKYKDVKMTYAGRLDPIASGLLLVLTGEETRNKEKYLALDKEYEFEILFGFATDTYDILGKIISESGIKPRIKDLKKNLEFFTGKFVQKYPAYSSKTVKGKPMFEYAREGKDVETPEREVNVKSLEFIKSRLISSAKLLTNIEKRIKKVKGDFRQKEILYLWHKYLHTSMLKHENYMIASFKIKCSSGTYVRSLANNLGDKLGIPVLAFSIKRTKIGNWSKMNK